MGGDFGDKKIPADDEVTGNTTKESEQDRQADQGDHQLEDILSPEEEKDFEKGKVVLAEIWRDITGADEVFEDEIIGLDNNEYIRLLYQKLKPALDKTVKGLGLRVDGSLLEQMQKTRSKKKKAELQAEIIYGLQHQFKDKAVDGSGRFIESDAKGKHIDNTWSFFPYEIIRKQAVNCSGAALLMGHILEENGIKVYQAIAPNHAFNIAELADGSLMYVDTRMNSGAKSDPKDDNPRVFIIKKSKKIEIGGVEGLEIEDRLAGHKTILVQPQYMAIDSMVGNFGGLKSEAAKSIMPEKAKEVTKDWEAPYQHGEVANQNAKRVYLEYEGSLSKLAFAGFGLHLFYKERMALKTPEWQAVIEQNKINDDFDDWLNETIGILEYTPEEKGILAKEYVENLGLIMAYYRQYGTEIDSLIGKLSPKNIDLVRIIKERLDKVRNVNPTRFEDFLRILEKR